MVEELHALQGAARQRQTDNTVECKFCMKKSKQKCLAYGKQCKRFGKENHFAVKCRKKKQVHSVAQYESHEYEDILCVTEARAGDVNAEDTNKGKDTQLFAGMLLGKM